MEEGASMGRRRPRVLERAAVGHGPLRDLKDLLYELYLAAQAPTLDDIVAAVERDDELSGAPSRDTVRRCLTAPEVPPLQADAVAVATVLARWAAWDTPDTVQRVRQLWIAARMEQPPGQSITSLTDPFALEVHRAIVIEPAEDQPTLSALPAYVPRAHDRRLADIVADAVAGNHACAMLVGGSSTGKTRACWETVIALPSHWRLWHPIDPGRPEELLHELPRLAPHTVIWLNDAHHYLLTPSDLKGEQVAAKLRRLLRTPERAPVLMLGTMWPEYWAALTNQPAPGQADPHAQARELLLGLGIPVASAFAPHDLTYARGEALRDPRLAHALEHAEHGRIAQYLAAAPALLERYSTAPDEVRALVEAAMDVRLLGHGPVMSERLLAEAAVGGLTDQQWDLLSEDWLDNALNYAVHPVRGAQGLLARVRAKPGRAESGPVRYRLADFIEQHGRRARRNLRGSRELWEAVSLHAEPESLSVFGESAHHRGLLRQAMTAYAASADVGSIRAVLRGTYLLLEAGRHTEAETWLGERLPTLGTGGLLPLNPQQAAWLARDLQRQADVLQWLDVRAGRADLLALVVEAHLMTLSGHVAQASEWMISYASLPARQALGVGLGTWQQLSDTADKLDLLRAGARVADAHALAALTALALAEVGLPDRTSPPLPAEEPHGLDVLGQSANVAADRCRTSTWTPTPAGFRHLLVDSAVWGAAGALLTTAATSEDVISTGRTLQAAAQVLECAAWLQRRTDIADPDIARHAAALLEPSPGPGAESALEWLRRAADGGDALALRYAARLLAAVGRGPEAERLKRFGWDFSERIASAWSLESARVLQGS
ncbi:hypothetical protein ACFW9L_03320 [Streptomyces sp. NPDC059517]|uniref:hypothetical protein n=1 Tax=Streptomyces sp. NPDC059517 TaxID=3346855 RepID=UPI0036B82221